MLERIIDADGFLSIRGEERQKTIMRMTQAARAVISKEALLRGIKAEAGKYAIGLLALTYVLPPLMYGVGVLFNRLYAHDVLPYALIGIMSTTMPIAALLKSRTAFKEWVNYVQNLT